MIGLVLGLAGQMLRPGETFGSSRLLLTIRLLLRDYKARRLVVRFLLAVVC